ncbi:hypothetical protein HGP28_02740 [Vibrio sp. SM6]|uniref:Fimbrial protein n=1 Tax=Vibrio agarilyticus TaxID=2726741 RepID=A0A7X8TNK4_9VIBR|nr:hypothetical protein [Vibrio agarilyticus]NLS11806.1 hypothetical protein [Vibrio agarilyticus]
MKSAVKLFSLTIIVYMLLAKMVSAADLTGELDATQVKWQSAIHISGGVTPALWDLPFGLPTGNQLIPGGHALPSGQVDVKLINASGDVVTLPITVKGIQYRFDGAASVTDDASGISTTVSGEIATVIGNGIGNKRIHFGNNNSMINSYRPIIEDLDAGRLVTLLSGKAQGTYSGRVAIPFQYEYYRNSVRIRQQLITYLDINLEYAPAVIFDVVITSGHDGKLTPHYHGHPDLVVSGVGHYGVRVTGDFATGLKAVLDTTATPYTLKNPVDETSEIPYSVSCTVGCLAGNVNFIDKGDGLADSVQLDNSNTSEANIVLEVGFREKLYSELVPGTYSGHFRILFEAEI